MSYFAKPNFIIYDEWFDEYLEKTKLEIKNRKNYPDSTIHDFFYEQSNYKVGASENNMQLVIKVDEKKLLTDNYIENTSEKYNLISYSKFRFFRKLTKNKFKFDITNQIIYSLSLFSFMIICGLLIFYVSSFRKSNSNKTTSSQTQERIFIFKRDL